MALSQRFYLEQAVVFPSPSSGQMGWIAGALTAKSSKKMLANVELFGEDALAAGIPVARATRVHDGPLRPADDNDPMVVMEDLNAWKARLHLMVALTITRDLEGIRDTVADGKYGIDVVAPSSLE